MYKRKSKPALWQSLGLMSAALVLISGVTFAALQSQQAVLKGNSIQTAMADLKLSKDAVNYSSSLDGYTFNNLIPGGGASPANGNPVYIMNTGSTSLALKLSLASDYTNPNSVNLAKVHLIITPLGGGAPQNITLQDLAAANSTGGIPVTVGGGGALVPGNRLFYTLQIVMDVDSTSSASASIGNLTFNFDATAVS